MKKVVLFLFFVSFLNFGFSQNQEQNSQADMYSAFHKFFDAEIRRQGVKLNWIFRLDEITGLHTFDINNDGLKEVLFEFDAVPVEGGGVTNSYTVLFFETETDKFIVGDYIETPYSRFIEIEGKVFRFYNQKNNVVELYVYENKKFKKVKIE